VPLKECKIPTLSVFPPPADGVFPVDVGEAAGVAVGVGVLQAFRNKLDVRVAELYKINFRRSNRFVIFCCYSLIDESGN
jgi:hypothetical protein